MKTPVLSYSQKNKILLVGSLVFCIIVYFFSVRKTVYLYMSNQRLEGQIEKAKNAPETIWVLQYKADSYNRILKDFSNDTLRREEYLLDQISNACKRNTVTLVSLPSSQKYEQDDFEIETRMIKARGGFLNLLRMVYDLEFNYSVGRITSARFFLEEDRQNNTSHLFLYLYIQNLHIKTNESR